MSQFHWRPLLACLVLVLAIGCGETPGGDRDTQAKSGQTEHTVAPDAPQADKIEAGFATGRVTMEAGKAITTPGVSMNVFITGITEAGERVSYSPIVKADGTYRQKLAPGSYSFGGATVDVPFEKKKYNFTLEPVGNLHDKNRDAAEGIAQDFVWKLTGPTPRNDGDLNNHTQWYGGTIGVRYSTYRNDLKQSSPTMPDGLPITFILTPLSATQIDGSKPKTITIERKYSARWQTCDALIDIPAAHYEMTGFATIDGVRKPLLFETTYAKYSRTQPISFEPDLVMRSVVKPLTAWVIE